MGVFEKMVLRLKFGPKTKEITEGFMICDLMKEERMRCAVHEAHRGKTYIPTEFW
jgi:hypothetical protein